MESPAQVTSIYKAAVCPSLLSSIFLCGIRANSLYMVIFQCSAQARFSLIFCTKSSQGYIRIPAPPSLWLLDSYSPLSSSTPSDSVTAFAVNLLKKWLENLTRALMPQQSLSSANFSSSLFFCLSWITALWLQANPGILYVTAPSSSWGIWNHPHAREMYILSGLTTRVFPGVSATAHLCCSW